MISFICKYVNIIYVTKCKNDYMCSHVILIHKLYICNEI